jgi:NAD(P)-dependent dehydrogenase (short-subunit alcohol dehydrogenase family)
LITPSRFNHMSYFVVTEGLRERLSASGAARIVNTASAAHQGATLDFDDLQSAKSFRAMRAYSCSKLCNILFTRELARRLHGTGVTANCLHPGFVATRFANESGGLVSRLAWLAKFFAISPAEGAETITYLASSPEVANVARKGERGRPLIGTDIRGASGPGRRASTAPPLGKTFER